MLINMRTLSHAIRLNGSDTSVKEGVCRRCTPTICCLGSVSYHYTPRLATGFLFAPDRNRAAYVREFIVCEHGLLCPTYRIMAVSTRTYLTMQ